MKKLLIGLALLVLSITAYAACTTHTFTSGGRIVTCTTCCDNFGNCNTNCFQGWMMWVLLDDEGEVIRRFDYAHEGAVEVKEKTYTFNELFELYGECLL